MSDVSTYFSRKLDSAFRVAVRLVADVVLEEIRGDQRREQVLVDQLAAADVTLRAVRADYRSLQTQYLAAMQELQPPTALELESRPMRDPNTGEKGDWKGLRPLTILLPIFSSQGKPTGYAS